jgi:putative acetyltransferase
MLIIRQETPEDAAAIRHVNEEAFGQKEEAEIVEKLRSRGVLTISLVAVQDNEIIGHIAFSPVKIESEHSSFEAIALAPMSVLPAYQRKGIGSQLVRAGLEECRRLGHEIIVVLGHPDYYPRFGFIPAKPKGIDCEFQVPDEAWMTLELKEGALAGQRGTVRFQPEFREAT